MVVLVVSMVVVRFFICFFDIFRMVIGVDVSIIWVSGSEKLVVCSGFIMILL